MFAAARRPLSVMLATAGLAVACTVAVAPAAHAQNCIASGYGNGYRIWCAPGEPGDDFRAVTKCRLSSSYATYVVRGAWVRQGSNNWSYGLCPAGWYPIQSSYETK